MGAVLALSFGAQGWAQDDFPSRPVRLVVPQIGGTGNDVLARSLAERLRERWKVPVVVENRPGANGTIAANYVLGQPADGATLFLAGVSNLAFNPFLYPTLSHDPRRDFAGVAVLANSPFVLVATPGRFTGGLPGFVEQARARPGEINYASGGMGNSTHLAMDLVAERAGVQLTHVPFNGGGASTSLLSGETPVMMNVVAGVKPLIDAGKLEAFAVTGKQRIAALPDVPTFAEQGYEVDVPGWYAIVVKRDTPAPVVQRINADINAVLLDPAFRETLAFQFLDPIGGPPETVEQYVTRDADAWGARIRALDLNH
ncbi:tripartite tricarboxylate transporter substrate binding protein [Verticiella sediminum]|uniref:Tripartite tricarboxylate transporter substrate binding protein n=2 Tax=Verticiella sediminum TaxID=1247510 RepID=A0A556ACY8_9BURK|nr:tripartite tricarboxylate transporter substrate binding protein [Verticiella sediminum]